MRRAPRSMKILLPFSLLVAVALLACGSAQPASDATESTIPPPGAAGGSTPPPAVAVTRDARRDAHRHDKGEPAAAASGIGDGSGLLPYNGGPVMNGTVNLYYIWYGDWTQSSNASYPPILTDFANQLGNSPLYDINTMYTGPGGAVSGQVHLAGSVSVGYTHGNALTNALVWTIVQDVVSAGKLPSDPNGVYFVLSDATVTNSDGFCSSWCGWHTYGTYAGAALKFAFIGDPGACITKCNWEVFSTPNNYVDRMASDIFHELSESVTDPLLNAWVIESSTTENADECNWETGPTYQTSSNATANVRLGNRDYLLQEMWVNKGTGYCAQSLGSSTPYGGTPWAIPGTIQAEAYDNGGQNVAYYDTTPGNTGGAYRSDDVDVEATTDVGGGYDVGWTAAGEWLRFSSNVASAGSYTVALRVAATTANETMHVEVNGVNVTGSMTVPNTGGWQSWATVTSSPFTLSAGPQVVRVVFDTGGYNLDWIQFATASSGGGTSTPHGGTPWAIPGTIQAENYDDGGQSVAYSDTTPGNTGGAYRSDDVDIEATTDVGGGYDVGWTAAGEWLKFSSNVATAGSYTVALRVAATTANETMHVEVNGVNVTGSIPVPNTGGWQTWATVTSSPFTLSAGPQVVRVVFDTGGYNLDWLQFAAASSCTPTTCAAKGASCGTIPDGCGGTLTCGTCTAPQTCGGGGTANVCGGGGGTKCAVAYSQGSCLSYQQGAEVSSAGHNWTCANANCENCAGYASCAPGGSGCPWGPVWTDDGACN